MLIIVWFFFHEVQKHASELIFTAAVDLLGHVSPNLPAVCFMVYNLIFIF